VCEIFCGLQAVCESSIERSISDVVTDPV